MRVLGGAARDAAQEVANILFDLTDPLARFLEKHVPLGSIRISKDGSIGWESGYGEGQLRLPELAKTETVAGAAAKDVVQFLIGFIPALHLAKAAKVASGTIGAARYLGASEKIAQALGSFAEFEIAAGVGTAAVFDGAEQRLSNLIQKFPALANPVSAYLAADPNDSKAEGKLKLAFEGLGFSVLMQPFVLGLRVIRAARAAKAKSVSEELADGDSILDRSLQGEELPQDVSAVKDSEILKENPFPDRIPVEDTECPFTMVRVKRHTTNRKLKKYYEWEYGVKWPIDPETGRDIVVHHVIPLLRGGADHLHNIEPMTYRTHIEHHKMSNDFSLAGKRGAKARREKQREENEESE